MSYSLLDTNYHHLLQYECVMGLKDFNGAGCILADDMGLGKVSLDSAAVNCMLSSILNMILSLFHFSTDSSICNVDLDSPADWHYS